LINRIDTIDDIRNGKTDVARSLFEVIGKVGQGFAHIYSIIDTSYTLKESVLALFESLSEAMEGVIGRVRRVGPDPGPLGFGYKKLN
jgi:hypothetical protein